MSEAPAITISPPAEEGRHTQHDLPTIIGPFPRVTGFFDGAGKFVSLTPEVPRYPHFDTWTTGVSRSAPCAANTADQPQLRWSQFNAPPGLTASSTNPPYGQDASLAVVAPPNFGHVEAVQHRSSDAHDGTFRPMDAIARSQPQLSTGNSSMQLMAPARRQQDPQVKIAKGFSPYYQGDVDNEENRSANIPDEENCSVFVRGLPPAVTYHQVLAAIRNTGRVYQTYLNPPEPAKGHMTSAGKVVFFDRPSAERFWEEHRRGFVVQGYPSFRGQLIWNRVKSAAIDGPKNMSRVLVISGPDHIVNEYFLTQFFQSKIEFQVDEVITHSQGGPFHQSVVEFRFGSFRCQAEHAKMALLREMSRHGVQIHYGRDPCDVVDST